MRGEVTGPEFRRPPRNRITHADKLTQELDRIRQPAQQIARGIMRPRRPATATQRHCHQYLSGGIAPGRLHSRRLRSGRFGGMGLLAWRGLAHWHSSSPAPGRQRD